MKFASVARKERITIIVAFTASLLAALSHFSKFGGEVVAFVVAGVALATLAALVGDATEHLGERLSPGATGVLQSAIGNLPELFVAIFALRAGLVAVVQAALIGSILANSLLVLGLAILFGGLRNGTQRFHAEAPRIIGILTLLAVAALMVPTLASRLHTPAGGHEEGLSVACAVALLVVFGASLPFSLSAKAVSEADEPEAITNPATAIHATHKAHGWSLPFTLVMLAFAGTAAAFVSDWFVEALQPAIGILGLSEAFTGLIIVAIAGNAVENVVGIQLAWRNKMDYAVSVILNSSLQVALGLTPLLVLLSLIISGAHLTLVLPPLLVAALALSAALGALITYDANQSGSKASRSSRSTSSSRRRFGGDEKK